MIKIISRLDYSTLACNVRISGCFIDSVYVRKLLQCLQVADNLTVPVNPRFATFPEILIPVMVRVILIECFDLGGCGMER